MIRGRFLIRPMFTPPDAAYFVSMFVLIVGGAGLTMNWVGLGGPETILNNRTKINRTELD